MSADERKRVCMFVFNSFTHDARVFKEAKTLAATGGLDVRVVGILDDRTSPEERRDGFHIIRIPLYPLTRRLLDWIAPLVKPSCGTQSSSIPAVRLPADAGPPDVSKKQGPGSSSGDAEPLAAESRRPVSPWRVGHHLRRALRVLIRLISMPTHRLLSFWDYYVKAYQRVCQNPADAYHAHDLNTLPVAYWAARRHKAKLVYDSHELYVERNRRNPHHRGGKYLLKAIERFLIRRADATITVNESIALELARRYDIPIPTVLMNTPSASIRRDFDIGRLRTALNIPQHQNVLLYCGSFTFNRGLEKLIQSLVYLPDCHLVMMGYGAPDYKSKLLGIAHQCEAAGRFSFFGPVPSDEVPSYAAGADLGVAPIENVCLSYYYCSPNKMFEYIAAGIPVIASDFPELRKVIDRFAIGATFNPDDPADIARAARRILDDPGLRQTMKDNTVGAAAAFNWENESQKLQALYKGLLSSP